MTATPTRPTTATELRRFVVTIHKAGSRRFRHVWVDGMASEMEAALYAQQNLCLRGETAASAFAPRISKRLSR
jgi:hypothetical protein